ncbi:MAG TPA: hypothetical protein VK745_27440 [Polyangiaceae bacterium]|jgi:hypothetical protein|nr:hypothetical protein [Polyangiaceae bacterium]
MKARHTYLAFATYWLAVGQASCRKFDAPAVAVETGGQDAGGGAGDSPGGSTPNSTNGGEAGDDLGEQNAGAANTSGQSGGTANVGGARPVDMTVMAGAPDAAGAAGDAGAAQTTNGPEAIAVPYCIDGVGNPPSLGLTGAIAGGETWSGVGIQAYVTQPQQQWIATVWGDESNPSSWTSWLCFNALPAPQAIATLNLSNGYPEVFVTTADGQLLVRREFAVSWAPWEELNLPNANSMPVDVAGVTPSTSRSHVFIADRDGIYFRYKTTDDPYSAYGAWQRAAPKIATRVTVGVQLDGALEIFALDAAGALSTAVQSSWTLGAGFGDWTDIASEDNAKLVDIDCGYSAARDPILYAVTVDGLLESRELSSAGWGAWVMLSDANTPKLTTVSAVVGSDSLFGVSNTGTVYRYYFGNWIGMP